MAGFGDFSLNALVWEDTYRKIGSHIMICCEEMKCDLSKKGNKLPNNENKIKDYLLWNYLDDTMIRKKYGFMMFHFLPEAPENYQDAELSYKGRVDIKIVSQNNWFENGEASYFVECKRIDGKKKLNNEYVVNGISWFVVSPPLYSSFYNKNYMLAFQVKNINTEVNVKKIELIQRDNKDINNLCGFIKIGKKDVFVYDCRYKMDDKIIELKHMFIDLSEVIGN